MRLFHYHLVARDVRTVEARYLGKLGFALVARYGRIEDEEVAVDPGVSWERLDRDGFRLRLTEVERGAVNVVVQPGHWRLPRVDHVGIALDEEEFEAVLERARRWGLRIARRGERRTFVSTNAGYRVEVHPPHEETEAMLARSDELRLTELQLRSDEPELKAAALAELLGLDAHRGDVALGDALVRFVPGGPEGRPELVAERFE